MPAPMVKVDGVASDGDEKGGGGDACDPEGREGGRGGHGWEWSGARWLYVVGRASGGWAVIEWA